MSGVASINIPYRKECKRMLMVNLQKSKSKLYDDRCSSRQNAKQIVIKYQPPYWNTMIFISLMSMILSAIFVKFLIQKRKMRK